MGTFTFNISLGKVNSYVERVDSNDPANSAIIVVPVDRGAATDATLKDMDTLAAVLGAVTERNTNNWNRKTLTDADLAAPAPDDANDRQGADTGDLLWSPGPTSGNVTDLIFCYDPDTTSGTDSSIIPLTCHAWAITPDGSEVTATVADFFRATSP